MMGRLVTSLLNNIRATRLCQIFTQPMIWERYPDQIIGYDLGFVQNTGVDITPTSSLNSFRDEVGLYILRSLSNLLNKTWVGQFLPMLPAIYLATYTRTNGTTLGDFSSETENKTGTEEHAQRDSAEATPSSDSCDLKRAYGYARQSQTDDKEGDSPGSIETQKANIRKAAKDGGYELQTIFVDKNESGFTFERPGYQDLVECLDQAPAPLILDRTNRWGRGTLETIYMAGVLHYEYEIPLITYRHGQYDLSESHDQIQLVINAITAGKSVEDRIQSAWEAIERRFIEDRNWKSWFKKVPLGYCQPDGENWLELADNGQEVINAIMKDLNEIGEYAKTVELIKKSAANETLSCNLNSDNYQLTKIEPEKIRSVFSASDYDLESFDGGKLQKIVTNSLYIGEIRIPRDGPPENQSVIEDPDLQVVDKELFDSVNQTTTAIANRYSRTGEGSVDVDSLADMGLLLKAVEYSDVFHVLCPDCGGKMVSNGSDAIDDDWDAHFWICPKYKKEGEKSDGQRKFPYNTEWEHLKKFLSEEYSAQTETVILKACDIC